MFIRQKPNKSGSVSVQIISKVRGGYNVIRTVGRALSKEELSVLLQQARQEMAQIQRKTSMFVSQQDALIESYLCNISNSQIQVIGPELVFGKIYDSIGFCRIEDELFRHLVIARLYRPGSKLKTIDYMERFCGIVRSVDDIYRFLDKLHSRYKEQIEDITFEHTRRVLGGYIGIVFYDITTLHFEASDEDDLRKMGFSKEGRHRQPQVLLGLLVGAEGFPIGYHIFEGNTFEGHTLLPIVEKFQNRFDLSKPVVITDAGLLSESNIELLEEKKYKYIIGARIKNEATAIKEKILSQQWRDGMSITLALQKGRKLIVEYSEHRAAKDQHNRHRGLKRLEKLLLSGKLTKAHINNRGYNKYLKLKGKVNIEIDYDKYHEDSKWDGLKGYITNARLSPQTVIKNYNQLWQIEKAFRISKTDLRIRPIYHRLQHRIEAHICIAFAAYAVYKELERILNKEDSPLSAKRAAELTHNMYQINVVLPDTQRHKTILLKMNEEQACLYETICKYF